MLNINSSQMISFLEQEFIKIGNNTSYKITFDNTKISFGFHLNSECLKKSHKMSIAILCIHHS